MAELLESDLFEQVDGTFGMIVSNPPYIKTSVISGLQEEVRLHDPFLALDGKEDGLFFTERSLKKAEHICRRMESSSLRLDMTREKQFRS